MYCTNCGKEIDDNAVICVHCGVATDNYFELNKVSTESNLPLNKVETEQRTNGLGIAAFVVGLVSLEMGMFFLIPCVAGLILSIIAMKNREKCTKCNGLAKAGLILSIVSSAIWTLWWFFMYNNIFTQ